MFLNYEALINRWKFHLCSLDIVAGHSLLYAYKCSLLSSSSWCHFAGNNLSLSVSLLEDSHLSTGGEL